jgi:MoCo/4Fe-4S cofactor protein with predicted Tat translocation signal
MKTIPPPCPEPEVGPKYWRSLDQLAERPEVREWIEREFPAGASLAPEGETRRSWMKLMSASFMFAGLGGAAAGCRRPVEHLTPFSKQPEGYIHGKPQYFATAMPNRASAVALVVKSSEGRPTKIEGNPLHPDSNGGTDAFAQASILNLYDPDRAQRHSKGGNDVKSEAVRDALSELNKKFAANGGEGLIFLAERSSSPSRARLQTALAEKLPKSKWFVYEPVDFGVSGTAYSQAFGAEVSAHLHLDKAQRILSLDCDFIGGELDNHHHISGFTKGRKPGDTMNRLYVVESLMTLTGGQADHRLRVRPTDVIRVAALVASKLGITGELGVALAALSAGAEAHAPWAEECAKDLLSKKGEAVVVAGYAQPLAVHLIVAAMNQALESVSKAVTLIKSPEPSGSGGIVDCVAALNAGADTLVILGGNPAYNAPVDVDFPAAAKKAKDVVRWGYYEDETSAIATWNIAAAHYLESWGDARTCDGTVVPVQPLIEPLFGGFTDIELLARLVGEAKLTPVEIVRETWKDLNEAAWKKFLHDGFIADSAGKHLELTFNAAAVVSKLGVAAPAADFDVVLYRCAKMDDGRFNNNGWLQELPDPVTKITWDNALLMSPKTAKDLGVAGLSGGKSKTTDNAHAHDGQYRQFVIQVTVGGRRVQAPVWVQPGMADNTVALALGYGRTKTGRVGSEVGANAYALLSTKNPSGSAHIATGGKLDRIPEKHLLAVTQEHGLMEGRPIVREANLEQYKTKANFAQNMDLEAHLPHYVPKKTKPDGRNAERYQNIYEHPYDANPSTVSTIHQWGMVIDLSTCVGCSACVIACQSENNIPIVGRDQVARGREMQWMRIDRYYSTATDSPISEELASADPQMVTQPMFCQHCEAAPCESVCPVNATVHDEEGINVMAYNRCIGTRYCANNCPFKVRRFNFFDYNKRESDYGKAQNQHIVNTANFYKGFLGVNRDKEPEWEIIKLVKNPDVSVRMRGVMEKCTFCIQRIEQAKISRKVAVGNSGDVAVPDGTIKTACQEVCPAGAITFGNTLDADSAVSKLKRDPRNYSVLGFLDVRPRVTYLARIRNPNPAIVKLEGRKLEDGPDTLRDYERHRHESPFKEHGQPTGNHEKKHAAAETTVGKGAA